MENPRWLEAKLRLLFEVLEFRIWAKPSLLLGCFSSVRVLYEQFRFPPKESVNSLY